MDIHLRKIQLVQNIIDIQDEKIIFLIENLIYNSKKEEGVSKITIDELNERIDISEEEFKKGKCKDAETLLNKYQ